MEKNKKLKKEISKLLEQVENKRYELGKEERKLERILERI